jgi:hypothetical protein
VKKIHFAVVAVLLGLAAILGTFAMTRTAQIGAASTSAQDAAVAERTKQLNAFEASLKRRLAASSKPAAVKPPAAAPRIVYHRPPPVVVVRHGSHSEDEGFEHEDGGDD